MAENELRFCFKGERNYIHGTDIYNRLIEYVSACNADGKNENGPFITGIDLLIYNMSRENITLSFIPPKDRSNLKFVFKYEDAMKDKVALYGLGNGKNVDCRYDYSEEKIWEMSDVNADKKEIILKGYTNFTFIENVVAMNKLLLETIYPDKNSGWIFARLQIAEPLGSDEHNIKLIFRTNFNFKLLKTEIIVREKPVGFIYFSLQ